MRDVNRHASRRCRDYLLLVPSYAAHLPLCSNLMRSLQKHTSGHELVSVRIVVGMLPPESTPAMRPPVSLRSSILQEEARFQQLAKPPSSKMTRREQLDVGVVRLDTIFDFFGWSYPGGWYANLQHDSRGREVGAAPRHNKYLYQFLKKTLGALYFVYEETLIVDSDSFFLPSLTPSPKWNIVERLFRTRANAAGSPRLVFMTTNNSRWNDGMWRTGCLQMLGATSESPLENSSAGPLEPDTGRPVREPPVLAPWGYAEWLWRRTTVDRLVRYVEWRHNATFLQVAEATFNHSRCFENSLYIGFEWMLGQPQLQLDPTDFASRLGIDPRYRPHSLEFLPLSLVQSFARAPTASGVTAASTAAGAGARTRADATMEAAATSEFSRRAAALVRELGIKFVRLDWGDGHKKLIPQSGPCNKVYQTAARTLRASGVCDLVAASLVAIHYSACLWAQVRATCGLNTTQLSLSGERQDDARGVHAHVDP